MPLFLKRLGLSKYAPAFVLLGWKNVSDVVTNVGADVELCLRERCGIGAIGARRKLVSELAAVTRRNGIHEGTQGKDVATGETKKRGMWDLIFPVEQKSKRLQTANGKLFSDRMHAAELEKGAEAKRKNGTAKRPRTHRYASRVPGTGFVVDSFYAAMSDKTATHFFLTHFHSDHYGGLTRRNFPAGGKIFATEITKTLVVQQLRISEGQIVVLGMEEGVDICEGQGVDGVRNGATVWAYDANHCPGAAVLLFYIWRTRRYVLHSGDCRFERAHFDRHAKLRDVIESDMLDYLYLDTTYCNPRYTFPPQTTVLEHVASLAAHENKRTNGKCVFFFGTYSIGKERVFLKVADTLNLHIHASKRKRTFLDKLSLGASYTSRIVSNPHNARVHVLPMRSLSADGLASYARETGLNSTFISRGHAVVFRPTGWTFGRGERSVRGDGAVCYQVAYSEHSSFAELVDFVAWSRAYRLVPTVNARDRTSAEALKKLLHFRERKLRQC